MTEITLSPAQIEDSYYLLDEAADRSYGGNPDIYMPERPAVPRPDFGAFEVGIASLEASAVPHYQNGRYIIKPSHSPLVAHFAGMRGFAIVSSQGQTGVRTITAPAILLEGGDRLAILTAEAPDTAGISSTQHALLDTEYVKNKARISAAHASNDVANAGEIGPSLVVASSGLTSDAHSDMHGLASNRLHTFGANFSKDQRQDIQVGHDIRAVRSATIDISRAIFVVGQQDQLSYDEALFGLKLSAGEMAVGMTLAASQSRGLRIDVATNLERMTSQ